ncbi:MAG: 2-haloacid dehalogenase [Nocardioidaceae bacterium]|jgi:2-haloacid dehalogenase|nr:2-haloacid dehalogenase [Nocardioidaceae bacterium]MEA2622378.1 2-haloacid dehalogenase [Chloroflexota bacterium]
MSRFEADLKPNAVLFDLGGVLIDWNPRHLYRSLFAGDEEAMEWFLANVTSPAWNDRQDRGRAWSEAVADLVEAHPDRSDLIRAFHERWPETLGGAHEETVAIAAELRARGVPLYALTNWSRETFPIGRERFPFLAWFAGIVVSGEEGMAKPDEAIFRLALERFDLDPGRTVFVDDSPVNVEKARALGVDAIRFTGAEELREQLRRRGLL